MLPLYASSAEQEKMNRHGYSGGAVSPDSPKVFFGERRVPTMGESGRGFSIRPDKYEKYQPRSSRSLFHRRKQSLYRLGGVCSGILLILMWLFPSLRPAAILTGISLALTSAGEEFNIETVRYYDLSNVGGTARGWEREERILLCAPLRDAAPHLPMFFSHLKNLTYPHNLIDLAFLVGDSKDNTAGLLSDLLSELQGSKNPKDAFGEISVIEKDFGQIVNQDVESRHGFAAQAGRRKSMAQARNWLLSAALRPTHSWVYWRDVDVETAPFTILEDLMRHNKDIIVPNVWRPLPEWLGGEQPYDLNSWQESETALALADTLDEDAVIVEGYAEYATWRPHLAYLRDPYGDPDMEMEIDGVGGVSILAKAKVFRSGVHFPAFSFEKHAETEGFGKMAKRMQFSVVGLPHYTIWHLYEPSFEDIRHMEELEQEREKAEKVEREKRERMKKIEQDFDVGAIQQYEKDKQAMRDTVKKMKEARNRVHPEEREREEREAREREEREKRRAAAQKKKEEEQAAKVAAGVKQPESNVRLSQEADGKGHFQDPNGEIKQLGGEPKGRQEDSANARAAAMKEPAAAPPGVAQVGNAAPAARPAQENVAPAAQPAQEKVAPAVQPAQEKAAPAAQPAQERAAEAEAPPKAQAKGQAEGSEWS